VIPWDKRARCPSTPRSRAGPSRCVSGWRARPEPFSSRPETFTACGFSDLRTGFVLRDESSRRRRFRAHHGSGRATPEHDAGSPALGPRPPPLAILRSTNRARISEQSDARAGPGNGRRAAPSRRLPRRARLALQSSPQPGGRLRDASWPGRDHGSRRPAARSRGQGHPTDHLHAVTEADWQAAAAQEAPSAGPSIRYLTGGNRTGTIPGCTQPSGRTQPPGPCSRPPPAPARRPTPVPAGRPNVHRVGTMTAAIRQGATLCHGMHRVTAERSFRSPDARRSRAGRPRRSQWSPGAHAQPRARPPARGHDPRPPARGATSAALPAHGPGTWPTMQRARPVPP
jgi:hypothetical protein